MSKISISAGCGVFKYIVSGGQPKLNISDAKKIRVGTMDLNIKKEIEKVENEKETFSAVDVETKTPVTVVNNAEKDVNLEEKSEKEPEDGMLEW